MKRVASHAGSWYSSDSKFPSSLLFCANVELEAKLNKELDSYFAHAVKQFAASEEEENTFPIKDVRAIIAP